MPPVVGVGQTGWGAQAGASSGDWQQELEGAAVARAVGKQVQPPCRPSPAACLGAAGLAVCDMLQDALCAWAKQG